LSEILGAITVHQMKKDDVLVLKKHVIMLLLLTFKITQNNEVYNRAVL